MKTIKLLSSVAVLAMGTGMASAQQPQLLPLDPAVRTGVLDNGFTYYLRHNNWPEGRTSFYLAQHVGSLQEEETQLGLAHFLEHMCFNGTEHFPGNQVWDFVQRNGLNNNAYTAVDRTIYFFDNVPSTIGNAGLDTCLIIMSDWAHGLILDAGEIDGERDVIHGEYRLRMQGANRIFLTELPELYPGRYGKRYPIGKMEIVDNFEHKELVDYYHRWYNPENQALIVVGDIDVEAYEQKVKSMFSGLTPHEGAQKVEEYPLDSRQEVYYSMAKDKDLGATNLSYNILLPEIPHAMRNSADYKVMNLVYAAATSVLNYRFSDLTPQADCPWMAAQAATSSSFVSNRWQEFKLVSIPKDSKQAECYQLMITELRRLVQYGITSDEYDRFMQEYAQTIDNFEANKDKIDNSTLALDLCNHYLEGDAVLDPDFDIMLRRQLQSLPVEAVNQMIAQLICTTGQNSSLRCWENEAEGASYVTKESLQQAFAAAQAAEIEAPADNSIKEPLMAALPNPGKIVEEQESKFGYKELTLSNGVRVYIRKSDVEPNTISLTAKAKAGNQQFEVSEFANFDAAAQMPYTLGGWNSRQLQKLLAGKKVGASIQMHQSSNTVNGMAGNKDLESMMQVVNLYFTALGRDDEMYGNILNQLRTLLPNRKNSSDAIFSDSVNVVMNSHDPRNRIFEVEDIDKLDYDRMLQMMKQPMQNAANFYFVISGDFDEAELRQYICQYIASLPSKGKADKMRTITDPKLSKDVICDFKAPISEPKVLSQVHWVNYQMPTTPQNVICSSLVGNILSNEHFRVLREEMSATYTPHCSNDFDLTPGSQYISLEASHTGLKPELADEALKYTLKSLSALADNCTAEALGKAQETMINSMREARDTQLYFYEHAMTNWLDYGYDSTSILEEFLGQQTPSTIQAWIKEFLKDAVSAQIIARPE